MILLWNSSEYTCRFSLVRDEERFEYTWEAGRILARDMLAHLRDALAEHEASWSDLAAIGVYRGPGSFTGLRIGLAVLNTLAEARNIPIVGGEGENWHADALSRLKRGDTDTIVLPVYGSDAHITTPRK